MAEAAGARIHACAAAAAGAGAAAAECYVLRGWIPSGWSDEWVSWHGGINITFVTIPLVRQTTWSHVSLIIYQSRFYANN